MKICKMQLADRITLLPTVDYYHDPKYTGYRELIFSWGKWALGIQWSPV